MLEPDEIPFNYAPNCPLCLSNDSYYWINCILDFPSFLDWDGDGDMDVLRKNLADQALEMLFPLEKEDTRNAVIWGHNDGAIMRY